VRNIAPYVAGWAEVGENNERDTVSPVRGPVEQRPERKEQKSALSLSKGQ